MHLQCYAGGGGNNPCNWKGDFSPGTNVMPGVMDGPGIAGRMAGWNDECTIWGGWVWLYDDFYGDLPRAQGYADAINDNVTPLRWGVPGEPFEIAPAATAPRSP